MKPRDLWVRFETVHDVTYFTPESRAATDDLGCLGGWMGYFGMRAAPLGVVPPEVVVSAFYTFHPDRVRRALPAAWAVAAPSRFLATRLLGADGALRRLLGDSVVESAAVAEAAELAVSAAALADTAGRPLAAANALLPVPEPPHLALWQACTVLRESRGDGHLAALIADDLDPGEALALLGADRGLTAEYLRTARGWPEPDWAAATERLTTRGLLTPDGTITQAGTELRREIEHRTDAAAARVWRSFGTDRTERLAALLTPLARTLGTGNEAMRHNPMALDAVAALDHVE